jgi:hypothetical protein
VTIGVTTYESNHIVRSEPRAVDCAVREAFRKELVDNGLERKVRHGSSSTLFQEMAAEILKQNLGSGEG